MEAKRFSGKRVLVTGAGTGIGREIALAFGREGADVVLITSMTRCSAAAEIQNRGPKAHGARPILFVNGKIMSRGVEEKLVSRSTTLSPRNTY